jgi:16S rRNA (uracil1498-N3)-methyltransferase
MDRDRRRKARLTAPGFLVLSRDVSGDRIVLRGDESRHACRVCRCRPGDRIEAADGGGGYYRCRVLACAPDRVEAEILERVPEHAEPAVRVSLAAPPIKGERFDWLVEKAVEAGVAEILPAVTSRTVVEPSGRGDRWRRVALAAMKQSHRCRLPRIADALPLAEVLADLAGRTELLLMPWEALDPGSGLAGCLAGRSVRSVGLLVGPEGGFTEEEVAMARDAGARPFSLGPRRLRTETAAILSLALVLHELECRHADR